VSTRYRCTTCGNLTRFDVTVRRRTRGFHHYSVGGDLAVEDEEVLSEIVESVECRWCGTGKSVVALPDRPEPAPGPSDATESAEPIAGD
jgi:rubredoxin